MDSWITSTVESLGYVGVAFLMFLENLFPPIPSELIMPMSGYVASQGRLSLAGVIVAGTIGSVLGAIWWYYVARWLGEERLKAVARRYGRWITFSPREVDKADDWFDRYGGWVVFFGRLIPTVRTLVAIPAGLFEMPFGRYLLLTTAGSAIWTGALAIVGHWLGSEYAEIAHYIDPFAFAVLVTIVSLYLFRVVTFNRAERRAEERDARKAEARAAREQDGESARRR